MEIEALKPLLPSGVEFVRLEGRYQVTLKMKEALSTPERGHLLLELEKRLRRDVDPQAEVFLEPKGDLNALRRKLRGVTAGWEEKNESQRIEHR